MSTLLAGQHFALIFLLRFLGYLLNISFTKLLRCGCCYCYIQFDVMLESDVNHQEKRLTLKGDGTRREG